MTFVVSKILNLVSILNLKPNLHAAEKLKSLMEKVNECSDDLDKVKDDFVSASTRFEVLQKQRKQRFEVGGIRLTPTQLINILVLFFFNRVVLITLLSL